MPSIGSKKAEVDRNKHSAAYKDGGVLLFNDGVPPPALGIRDAGRVREGRRTDAHGAECPCHLCRQVCCLTCHKIDPKESKIWRGLTGFGRHVQVHHSHLHTYKAAVTRERRLVHALKEVQAAKEIARISRSGLRRVNLKNITERDLETISEWVQDARRGGSADPILLGAIELADEKYITATKFKAAIRTLASEVERGVRTGRLVTSQRTTHFDPRIASELLKICYATGRGWSFAVHIVLLYGLEAFVETIRRDGVSPPPRVPEVPDPNEMLRNNLEVLDES